MSSFTDLYPSEPVEVDNADLSGMHHAMDDLVWSVLDATVPSDNTPSNIKIGVGAVCCALGVAAYFPPLPHPDNIPLVSLFIVLFVVLYGGLNAYIMFKLGPCVFISQPLGPKRLVLSFSSDLDPNTGDYTLSLSLENPSASAAPVSHVSSLPITSLWDSNGVLDRKALATHTASDISAILKGVKLD